MRFISKPSRLFFVAAVAALSLYGVGAASAVASPVPTTWEIPGSEEAAKLTGESPLTVTEGTSKTTCSLNSPSVSFNATNSGGQAFVSISSSPLFNCANGKQMTMSFLASRGFAEGAVKTLVIPSGFVFSLKDPFGGEYNADVEAIGAYKNGSGSIPSRWTFGGVTIGHGPVGAIKITGEFTMKKSSGGLLTLK